jgi:hypothetical protein
VVYKVSMTLGAAVSGLQGSYDNSHNSVSGLQGSDDNREVL